MRPLSDLHISHLGKYFHKLAETSQDVFWVRDADYKTQLYISPAYEKIWGIPGEKLYENSESWFASLMLDDRERVVQEIEHIKLNPRLKHNFSLEYRIVRPDNQIRWIQEIGFPLFDAGQKFLGYAGVAKDITYEKGRVAELEAASRFLKLFAEKTHAVFWAHDPYRKKQIYVSPAYEKIFGRTCESLYQDPVGWINSLVPEDRSQHTDEARVWIHQTQGADAQYENRYRVKHPTGRIVWIKDTSFPIYDQQNQFMGFAGIAEDVTKDVMREQELQEAKQRVEIANQAKADFLAMMGHELRTPLNAILGVAQILKRKGIPPELEGHVDIIRQAGLSLLSLVDDVLDFARLDAGKLAFLSEPFDLRLLLLQVTQSLHHQAKEKGLALRLEYNDELPLAVLGDANRIRQVVANLLSNAIKFTESGSVKVIVECLKKTKSKALFSIAVSDTGIGMREDKLEFIFGKFNQIDSAYHRKHHGVGLGLAITKELVEKMGGAVQVKSKLGKGSEFIFTLPLKLQKQVNHAAPDVGDYSYMHENRVGSADKIDFGIKVLVVEDNLINQKIARIMLEDFGCQVDVVSSGSEAIAQLQAFSGYDIIFMDIGLPDMSGFDIARVIRQQEIWKDIPIIAMTAHILEHDKEQAYTAGMDSIVPKPITFDAIATVLSQLVTS